VTTSADEFPQCKVGFFDVLGFKQQFENIGLPRMLEKYRRLTHGIHRVNAWMDRINKHGIELPIWTGPGELSIMSNVNGAYVSDSLVLWSKHEYDFEHKIKNPSNLDQLRQDPGEGYIYWPIPNDRLIESCAELICSSIECSMPIRGGIAAGQMAINTDVGIFIGQPMIDAVQIEGAQRFIGAALGNSVAEACSPSAFVIPFNRQRKSNISADVLSLFSPLVVDWPRFWRESRRSDLIAAIEGLRSSSTFDDIYDNTRMLIEESVRREKENPPIWPPSPTKEYPQFSKPGVLGALMPRFDDA
jgi:hypothetical protein